MTAQAIATATPNERRILRRAEVEAKTGSKRAHIYNLIKEGKFPKPLRLGGGRHRQGFGGDRSVDHRLTQEMGVSPRCAGIPSTRSRAMQVVSVISTKDGVGKTTTAANLGGFIADAGLRVLLLDLDVQPTLSSYFTLGTHAPAGIYEMLAFNEQRIEQLASQTAVAGLDLVVSNDHRGELNTLLLHAPDGRLRLRHLLPALSSHYDLLLIDTQGARSVLLEMAVLASSQALSPVTPEILAAPEYRATAAARAHQPCASGFVERSADSAGSATSLPGARWHTDPEHRRPSHRSLPTCRNTGTASASH